LTLPGWSISPTFYKQLFHHYYFAKKNKNANCKKRKAAKICSHNVGEID